MSRVLMRSLLITGLLSGLVVNYSPQKVLGIENPSSPILMLAEAETSTISIKDLSQKANELDAEIGQLNLKLKQVIKEEIDRSEIDFNLSKDKLNKFKEQWEQWKQSLTQEQRELLKEKIDKTDQYLTRIEGVINPLTADIIPTKEQFQASPETPLPLNRDLKVYQEKLFGENANPSDTDGVFGTGTQTEIESVLVKHIKEIKAQLLEMRVALLENNSVVKDNNNSGNLQSENQRLYQENQRLQQENQQLKSQIANPSVSPSPLETNSNPELPPLEKRNLGFLIPWIVLGIVVCIIFVTYRQVKFSRTTRKIKRKASRKKLPSDNKRILETSEREVNHFDDNEDEDEEDDEDLTNNFSPSPQNYSISSYSYSPVEEEIPITTSNWTLGRREKTTPKIDAIDLYSINDKDDLVTIYNNYRQVFEKEIRNPQTQIIEMLTVDKKSIENKRLGLKTEIIFTPSQNGNYFIFCNFALDKDNYCYCLLPKPKLTINSASYTTFNEIFQCENYEQKHSNEFVLRQTAIVVWTDQGIWLYEPGIIYFK